MQTPRNPLDIIYGRKKKTRKAFKTSTKKMEWMSSAGKDALDWRTNFAKKSRCRNCKQTLTWGDRGYEFDHKDDHNSNASQKNCFLVCRNCHGKATVIKKKKVKDRISGLTVGYKTIKKKVGYKKATRRKKPNKMKIKAKPKPFDIMKFF